MLSHYLDIYTTQLVNFMIQLVALFDTLLYQQHVCACILIT